MELVESNCKYILLKLNNVVYYYNYVITIKILCLKLKYNLSILSK